MICARAEPFKSSRRLHRTCLYHLGELPVPVQQACLWMPSFEGLYCSPRQEGQEDLAQEQRAWSWALAGRSSRLPGGRRGNSVPLWLAPTQLRAQYRRRAREGRPDPTSACRLRCPPAASESTAQNGTQLSANSRKGWHCYSTYSYLAQEPAGWMNHSTFTIVAQSFKEFLYCYWAATVLYFIEPRLGLQL